MLSAFSPRAFSLWPFALNRGFPAPVAAAFAASTLALSRVFLTCDWFVHQESWTFTVRDREESDVWTNGLVHAIDEAATRGDDDMVFDGSATSVGNVDSHVFFNAVGVCRSSAPPRSVQPIAPALPRSLSVVLVL